MKIITNYYNFIKDWASKHQQKILLSIVLIVPIACALFTGWALAEIKDQKARLENDEQIVQGILKGELPLLNIAEGEYQPFAKVVLDTLQRLSDEINKLKNPGATPAPSKFGL